MNTAPVKRMTTASDSEATQTGVNRPNALRCRRFWLWRFWARIRRRVALVKGQDVNWDLRNYHYYTVGPG